jgi:hypothetical protein
MAYRTLLTNTIGKTKVTIKNISFNMHYQKLIQGKGKKLIIFSILSR